ncbi:MAG: NAD(P)-dependent alcohol dehydrogenase [Thaumarchaeota archaeon]|nr:NAD(P)-dependent alcohol dehydrogenase [Candidatus Calditenuaceae archaeon]MDW8187361.1 NAD(P)-dependent alcohol dehydrogenase [Nitrososphaerota archaeon]
MKAARLFEYHKPLKVVEADYPKITRPDQVIVRIKGAGVCHTDLHIQEGMWHEKTNVRLPYTPGHENAGTIEEVGEGVEGFKKNDPVILHPAVTDGTCRACRAGEDMHCENLGFPGLDRDGGFAEFVVTSVRSLVRADGLDLTEIAPLADAGLTAIRAVKKAATNSYPGAFIGVVGVGGLGHIAIQLLRHMSNASIIAVDIVESKLKLAEQFGAHYVVDAKKDAVKSILEITKGKGVNAIIDFVGTQATHDTCYKSLRKGGKFVIVGYGGMINARSIDMIASELTVEGSLVGNYLELADLVELARQGKVRVVTNKYPLDRVNEVLESLKGGGLMGRAVLTP